MIDRRNTYRAKSMKPKPHYLGEERFELQFRRWFWPFWQDTFLTGNMKDMREQAVAHAAPFEPRFVGLGKFPRTSQDKGEPTNG